MIRLRTFGSIDLRSDGGAPLGEALAQPKRVALLTYLAAQAGGFCRRDTLVALLWPELDTDRARHSLRQAVYLLRRWLGQAVVVGRGEEELGIDRTQLWCDSVAFRELLDEGRPEEALALYGGDFLAGFHPPEASEEFEDWIAATRLEHRTAAIRAALTLARDAIGAGDLDRALEFSRWAAAADPLNEGIQVELITVLGRKGDKAGAQRAYKAFAERLQRELNSSPAPATRKALADAEHFKLPTTSAPGPPAELPAPKPSGRPSPGVVIAFTALVILVGATLVFARRSSHGSDHTVLAVGTIRQDPGGHDSTALMPIADLLATSLARLPDLQVLSNARLIEIDQALRSQGRNPTSAEVARRAQATEILEGSVFQLGADSLVLELRRVDIATGRVLHGYRVGARDAFALVDRATAEIAREADVQRPTRGIADVTTGSLVAYRLYEEGLRSFYAGDATAARRFFETAVSEDSTFATAMWYLARTEANMTLPIAGEHYFAALRLAAGASDRERLLITADVMRGDSRSQALALAETLTTRYPSDPEGFWILGAAQASASNYDKAVVTLRRAIGLDSAVPPGAGRACRPCEAYQSLITIHLYQDSLQIAFATAQEFARRWPREPIAWSSLAEAADWLGDTVTVDTASIIYDRLVGRPRGIGIDASLLRQIGSGNYLRADTTMVSLGMLSEELRPDLRWYLSISLRNQGRLREAVDLTRDGSLPAGGPLPRWQLGVDSLLLSIALFESGDTRACRAWYHHHATAEFTDLRGWPGLIARERVWALGRLAMCRAAAGDTAGFERLADSLQTMGAEALFARDQRIHHYVRGLLWKARGDYPRAAAEFSAAITSPNFGFTRINYELAGVLLNLRRPAEAVAALQPALRGLLDASNLYLSRTEIHERLAQAWDAAGNADSALAHWRAVERAWRRADPQFRARYEVAADKVRRGEAK